MRGPLISGVTGDGGSGVSKRANGIRHQLSFGWTWGSDSSSFARSTAWEDVVSGNRATGQHASYRAEPGLDYFFGNGPSRFKVMAGAFNHYECIASCS